MSGTITQVHRDRGVGTLLGEDRKSYSFRRNDVRAVWFHDLTEGTTVVFEPGKDFSANQVRPLSASVEAIASRIVARPGGHRGG